MECLLSETDLNGILFSEYPDELTLEESRERLELDVEEACEELDPPKYVDDVDIGDDGMPHYNGKTFCVNPIRISAYTIQLVISHRAHRAIEKMSPREYKDYSDLRWRKRAERFEDKRKKTAKRKESENA